MKVLFAVSNYEGGLGINKLIHDAHHTFSWSGIKENLHLEPIIDQLVITESYSEGNTVNKLKNVTYEYKIRIFKTKKVYIASMLPTVLNINILSIKHSVRSWLNAPRT